jgi:hypothetical protein
VIEQLPTKYTIRIDNILNYEYQVIASANIRVDLINLYCTKIESADFNRYPSGAKVDVFFN